jgi:hypothetical protein
MKRVSGWLFNRLVYFLLVLAVVSVCGVLTFHFHKRLELAFNQERWESVKPSAYSMVVTEVRPDGGSWRWLVYVEESRPVTVTLLNQDESSHLKSWLDPNSLTIDQLFAAAATYCTPRSVFDCRLSFDPEYHYPVSVKSYELVYIEVEALINCDESLTTCSLEDS